MPTNDVDLRSAARDAMAPSGSKVRIGYTVALSYEIESPAEFIFNLHAARTAQQRVVAESFAATPDVPFAVEEEPGFGNRLARLSAEPGALAVRYAGTVEISHVLRDPRDIAVASLSDLPA